MRKYASASLSPKERNPASESSGPAKLADTTPLRSTPHALRPYARLALPDSEGSLLGLLGDAD